MDSLPHSRNVDARKSSFYDVGGDQYNLVFNVPESVITSDISGPSVPPTSILQRSMSIPPRPMPALDLLFLQDSTGSQQPYIKSAVDGIDSICNTISLSVAPGKLRVGLIAFRDYPPQDNTFVTKNFGFTSDIAVMRQNLQTLVASGGGDGAEAQAAALSDALNMNWRKIAVKIVVLITDAPPHGIGEADDGFPEGSPDQNDPLVLARTMAQKGIILFLLACEPTLSTHYQHASDFYRGLVEITFGATFPLISANNLADYIIGTVLEAFDIEAVISKHGKDIAERIRNQAATVEDVAAEMCAKLQGEGLTTKTFTVENIYTDSAQSLRNKRIWHDAQSLATGRALVSTVREPRILEQFRTDGSCRGK